MLDREDSIEVVGIAGDGREAIDLTLMHNAQVVLMDVRMPVMDGIEASKRLHAIRPEARVVLVTSLDQDELGIDLAEACADSFLSKSEVVDRVVGAVHDAAGARA